jgi:hypothetical protein
MMQAFLLLQAHFSGVVLPVVGSRPFLAVFLLLSLHAAVVGKMTTFVL